MIKKVLLAISLLFISSPALAVAGVQLDADDEALFYMRVIFGDAVMFLADGQIPESEEYDSVIGKLAFTFNSSMILLNMILVGAVFFMAFFDTAHKGKLDTNKYDTVWLPLRLLLSLAVVTPISGGYNSMQMGVFYVAGAGIQTANQLTQASIEYMYRKGSVINLSFRQDLEKLGINLLQSWVCTEAYNKIMNDKVISLEPKTKIVGTGRNKTTVITSGYGYSDKANSYPCGSYDITANEIITVYEEVTEAKDNYKNSLFIMIDELNDHLRPIAISIVNSAELGGVTSTATPNPQAFDLAIKQAKETMDAAGEELVGTVFNQAEENDWSQETKDIITKGNFINLGTLYWTWSTITQKVLDIHKSTSIQSTSGITQKVTDEREMELAFTALSKYLNEDRMIDTYDGYVVASQFPPKYKPVVALLTEEEQFQADIDNLNYKQEEQKTILSEGVIGALGPLVEPVNDPLTTIVITGQRFINLAEIALYVRAAINTLISSAEDSKQTLDSWIPGTGVISLALKTVVNFLIETLKLLALAAMAIMLASATLGFMAAIYIPAIPIVQWVLGVLTYFISMVELVVVSTVHAVAHALPEGRGITGQHARNGYMLILGLFLSPSLMVFGFYSAIILCNIGGMLLISMWSPFFESSLAGPNGTMGMFFSQYIILPFGMGFVFLISFITIVQRSFQLINEIRDRALKMIGGGAENFGDGTQMDKMNQQVAIAGGVTAAGTGAFSGTPTMPNNNDDDFAPTEPYNDQGGSNDTNDSVSSKEAN